VTAVKPKAANKVRIIGGNWRSRQIRFIDSPGLRPTPDRVRETLFNWLQFDLAGANCLDLFAGSGALGFEAASRGAGKIVLIDDDKHVCQMLNENVDAFAADQVCVVNRDALQFLSMRPDETFDLVFLDPPFFQGLIVPACHLLEKLGWLTAGSKIYLETERHANLSDLPDNWRILKNNSAGKIEYRLFRREP
jgi:16S rRNA (guanine966-N2)-methyltransferase